MHCLVEETKLFNREGSKFKYKNEIIELFPEHNFYVEPFFGTGSIFFNKPKAKYNSINDNSKFIYHFFKCLKEDQEKLYEAIYNTPVNSDYLWENEENDTIYDFVAKKILISVCSLFTASTRTIVNDKNNKKTILLDRVKYFKKSLLENVNIFNKDVFSFLKTLSSRDIESAFVYCDPPYSKNKGKLDENKNWNGLEDLEKLIVQLKSMDVLFAISEYGHEEVIQLFEKHGLYINTISVSKFGYSKRLGGVEILACNYKREKDIMDFV